MKICGFQKMTLLDFPGCVAATIFTGGCNLRCPFCHNALLVTEVSAMEEYSEDFILSYLEKRKGVLDGIAVTGGEPLLQKDIRGFLEKVRRIGYKIKLDTNGTYPDKLKELVGAGLVDYVAMDIKNHPDKYPETTGIWDLDMTPIEESVRFLKEGFVPYEFRTTVVAEYHTPEDIGKIGQWIQGAPKYFLQQFKDSGNLIGTDLHGVDLETLHSMREIAAEYVPETKIRGVD